MTTKDLMIKLYKMAVENPKILDMDVLVGDQYRWWYDTRIVDVRTIEAGRERDNGAEVVCIK